MRRSTKHFACAVCVLVFGISLNYPVSAAVLNQADQSISSHTLGVSQSSALQTSNNNASSGQTGIATSHDTTESHIRDFMQQITNVAIPAWMELILPQSPGATTNGDDAMQLMGPNGSNQGHGSSQLPLDSQWFACCGDGTVLAAIDSSFRTLVNTPQQQTQHRSASFVSIAKTGSALPLSFEVSRRVRAQSVPEPTSISILGLASLMLLRRSRRNRHRI